MERGSVLQRIFKHYPSAVNAIRMKMLYIANARIPTEKAHGIQIMKMCEAFARSGADVNLIVPWRFNTIKEDPFYYYNVERIFKITTIPSIDFVAFGRLGFLIQTLSFISFAIGYVLLKRSDVIYSRDELVLFFLSLFKDTIFWEMHINRWNFIIKRVVKVARSIVVITHGLKTFLHKKGVPDGKIVIAHDGVDLALFSNKGTGMMLREQYGIPATKKVIGHIGKLRTMGRGKGVEDVIVAFSNVIKEVPEALLLLVGPNEEELPAVYTLLEDLGITTDSCKIVAHVPQRDVPSFMHMSDVLVMYYPTSEHYKYYMSPLKLFEYMASGVPIVTSDLPSIREILNVNNAVLVEAHNTKALAHGIIDVLHNTRLARDNAIHARADVTRYSWEKRAEHILGMIKSHLKQ